MTHPSYVGPKLQVEPDALPEHERRGGFVAEEKHDGHWCTVITDASGRVSQVLGRSGKGFSGANVDGILGAQTRVPCSSLVGELESGTEAALARLARFRRRRVHLFDVVALLGHSTVGLPYERRRELLQMAQGQMNVGDSGDRFLVTRMSTSGFSEMYAEVLEGGGEGLVLKRLGSSYVAGGSSQKTEAWIKVKAHRLVDYVVVGVGKSAGGSDNIQVGLFVAGTLTRICGIKQPPPHLRLQELVGRVIECRGAEVHQSGALRHGHFERIRADKRPEECTLEAALAVG